MKHMCALAMTLVPLFASTPSFAAKFPDFLVSEHIECHAQVSDFQSWDIKPLALIKTLKRDRTILEAQTPSAKVSAVVMLEGGLAKATAYVAIEDQTTGLKSESWGIPSFSQLDVLPGRPARSTVLTRLVYPTEVIEIYCAPTDQWTK